MAGSALAPYHMMRGKQDPLSISQEKHLVSPDGYEAWLFDLDGVITDTASVHAVARKWTLTST